MVALSRARGSGSRAAAVVLALCTLAACADNPYVIGAIRAEDAAVGDAGVDASAPPFDPCESHTEALVCSGFEREDLADWPSRVVVQQAQVERSTARSRSGVASLHATSRGADSTAVVARAFEPRLEGMLHLRVWLRVPADVATETMNLFFLGFDPNPSEDPAGPFVGLDLNLEDGAVQAYSPQNAPARVTGTLQIPRERWFCFRAEVAVADAGALRVFVDDALALDLPEYDTLPDEGVSLLRAGIDWSSGQTTPFEVYMDDLVLSTEPVACSDP